MENTIIQYGKKIEAQMELTRRIEEDKKRSEELKRIEEVELAFMEVFSSILGDLEASGVKFFASRKSHVSDDYLIEFHTQYEGGKSEEGEYDTRGVYVMEWHRKTHYRYNSGQQFGEWPVKDLLWNIYLKCFKED